MHGAWPTRTVLLTPTPATKNSEYKFPALRSEIVLVLLLLLVLPSCRI